MEKKKDGRVDAMGREEERHLTSLPKERASMALMWDGVDGVNGAKGG